ncbi:unnamed protein product [Dicrocoelium dendriticum]|nr:unnamed protein product [Dicrocoelium dendriticum]
MPRCSRFYECLKAGIFVAFGATAASLGFSYREKVDRRVEATESPRSSQLVPWPSFVDSEPVKKVGIPSVSHLRIFDGFVCAYDRRTRIPLWVLEHLTPEKLSPPTNNGKSLQPVDRSQLNYYEDLGELHMFRATNEDYKSSGYDRGHMAAAGNHLFERAAMAQTFILSNIAPQVGRGFNRHAWNDLEKYVRAIARNTHNVVVVTGPLFLPHASPDATKKFVTYEVIGPNDVAVPTHFFKAISIQEAPNSSWKIFAWVLPNMVLPEKVDLRQFQVPLSAVERASGLKLFPNLPR